MTDLFRSPSSPCERQKLTSGPNSNRHPAEAYRAHSLPVYPEQDRHLAFLSYSRIHIPRLLQRDTKRLDRFWLSRAIPLRLHASRLRISLTCQGRAELLSTFPLHLKTLMQLLLFGFFPPVGTPARHL